MSKFIIENRTELNDAQVFFIISNVIKEGRVSNNDKQYPYLCTYIKDDIVYNVASFLNKKSDRFVIYKTERNV